MLFEAILEAFENFASANFWLYLMGGVIVGLIFGVLPAVGAIQALALFLPFVFLLKPMQAFPFMMGVIAACNPGGSITTILVGVPGNVGDVATLLDGYPMTKKGEAGRALGIALTSGLVGTCLTVFTALLMVPIILPVTMSLFSAEMVVIIVLGLTFISALASGSMVKGLLSGVMGMLVSFIGFQTKTGLERFTFGTTYLYDGIPLVAMGLGLFAMPAMIELAITGGTKSRANVAITGMREVWQGGSAVLRHKILVLRAMIVAFIAGIAPGVSGSVAGFVSYAQAKKASKHPEKFGTGVEEGVIASQTAINGEAGGALLTTLALGLPGNASQALVLAAFIMLGLVPGPEMMTKHLGMSLTLLYVLLVASVIGTIICLAAAPQLARMAYLPTNILSPLVVVIVFVGAFAAAERVEDIFALLFCTALGLVIKKYRFSAPSLFLGYILGSLFERYLFLALGGNGPFFFLRPISLSLIVLMIIYFSYGPIKRRFQQRRVRA